jgi:uncharacterized protein (DUF1330 family)
MAMIISDDVLFLHVRRTGSTSATQFLLESLPTPVQYVSRGRHKSVHRDGVNHDHGNPHQTLAEAQEYVRGLGRDLSDFRLIMAVVRNPYDHFVSHYSYQKRRSTEMTTIAPADAPPPTPRRDILPSGTAVLDALTPGRVARVAPEPGELPGAIRVALNLIAVDRGVPVAVWERDGTVYAKEGGFVEKTHRMRDAAQSSDFRTFVEQAAEPHGLRFLHRGKEHFFLDGQIPSNLRILRFERLADDVREALREIGIRSDAGFPWLNRSDHAAYSSYYDEFTEQAVYDASLWLFDRGFYQRLNLTGSVSDQRGSDQVAPPSPVLPVAGQGGTS